MNIGIQNRGCLVVASTDRISVQMQGECCLYVVSHLSAEHLFVAQATIILYADRGEWIVFHPTVSIDRSSAPWDGYHANVGLLARAVT
jgi:hypothetical protein